MRALTDEERDRAASCVLLAWKLAGRSARDRPPSDRDYFHDAAIDGLLAAAANFDASAGHKFSTFAYASVRLFLRRAYWELLRRPALRVRPGRLEGRAADDLAAPDAGDRLAAADELRALGLTPDAAARPARAVWLRLGEGLTMAEAGRAMGCRAETVAQYTHRGLKELRAAARLRGGLETG